MTKSKKPIFSSEFLDKIKKLLDIEEEKLKADLGQFAKPNPHVKDDYDTNYSEYGDDMEENAHEVSEYISNKPLELSLEKTLRDVHTAEDRLKKGTYGVCKYCDQPIDEKRLLARPTSSSCVSCKKTLTDEV
ncbi:MAG: TraR/DksA family transcriptional regulator [Patescibacteria group bacterium]